jgi:hypothetical protein
VFIFGPFVVKEWNRSAKVSAESMNYTIRLKPEEMVFMRILDVKTLLIARLRSFQSLAIEANGQPDGNLSGFTLKLTKMKINWSKVL